MSMQDLLDQERRLVILRSLSEMDDYSLNESLLGKMVARYCTGVVGADVLRAYLQWLETHSLLKLEQLPLPGGTHLWVAKLTRTGAEVVRGRPWPGIARPSPR